MCACACLVHVCPDEHVCPDAQGLMHHALRCLPARVTDLMRRQCLSVYHLSSVGQLSTVCY